MVMTIDIPGDELDELMRRTGASTAGEAIATAIVEFNRRCRLQELAEMFGKSTTFINREDLRRMREES